MNHERNEDRFANDRRKDSRSKTTEVFFLAICGLLVNGLCIFIYPQPAQFIYHNLQKIGESLFFHGR
jgi:hypothetical protein